MGKIAYSLRSEYEENYAGGLLTVGEDRTFDVAEELEAGNGYITIDDQDHMLVTVLDDYPALKRTTVKAAEESAKEQEKKTSQRVGQSKSAESSGGKDSK